ncbi:MAG: hypothetical protein A2Z14_10070 [Chloroflexi bacterium RBG_16_48_8]|nr:MAG: hypothetical protein A2Z14_10070 [Chloroflexi bacterium RBG_16_48_8]
MISPLAVGGPGSKHNPTMVLRTPSCICLFCELKDGRQEGVDRRLTAGDLLGDGVDEDSAHLDH